MVTNSADWASIVISALTTSGIIVLAVFLFSTKEKQRIQDKPFLAKQEAAVKMIKFELPDPPRIMPIPQNKVLIKPLSTKIGNHSLLRPEKSTAYKKKVERKVAVRRALQPTKRELTPLKQRLKKNTKPLEKISRKGAKGRTHRTVIKRQKTKLPLTKKLKPAVVRGKQHIKSRHTGATGRVLLRMLEHGKGPSIEIAWPEYRGKRQQLFRAMRQCFGMKSAVLNFDNLLYTENYPSGTSWNFNVDKFSGFLRSPAGEPIFKENNIFQKIARHHGLNNWKPVRVFPRPVDGLLLGGLEKIVGQKYGNASDIHARYELGISGLLLTGIYVDRHPVEGTVEIPYPVNQHCNL